MNNKLLLTLTEISQKYREQRLCQLLSNAIRFHRQLPYPAIDIYHIEDADLIDILHEYDTYLQSLKPKINANTDM